MRLRQGSRAPRLHTECCKLVCKWVLDADGLAHQMQNGRRGLYRHPGGVRSGVASDGLILRRREQAYGQTTKCALAPVVIRAAVESHARTVFVVGHPDEGCERMRDAAVIGLGVQRCVADEIIAQGLELARGLGLSRGAARAHARRERLAQIHARG